MKRLVIYMGKKYIISAVNDVLEKYKYNVSIISEVVTLWIKRLQIIIEELKNILSRLSDGKIEDDEIEKSKEEIEKIVKNWE